MEFWDKRAEKYNDEIEKHDAAYKQTIERTKALLSPSDVLLDLGCATGEFGLDLAPHVQRVHGVDTSANMIAMAKKKASDRSVDNVTFASTDVFDRSLDLHGYTGVLAFSVFHLVENLRAVLGRVNQLLSRDGLLISETPCFGERGPLFRLLVGFAQKVQIAPPIINLTVAKLETEISEADFDIAESRGWVPKKAIHWIVARKRQGTC